MLQFRLFSRCGKKVTFKFRFCDESPKMWHLNQYFLTIFALKHAPITVSKNYNLYIFCYKFVCFVLPKTILTFSPKKMFFLRKHDFSRKSEGGTGLQGVSSNLNLSFM